MDIAIMGAGLSGLACAAILEQHGVTPTIYDNRDQVGDRFVNGEVFMEILNVPITDSHAYLSEKHHIYIQPIANLKRVIIISPHSRAEIEGHLGYSSVRGRHPFALENQLAKQVSTPIHFNSKHSYEELLRKHTHVVMATGDLAYATKLQPFKEDLSGHVKGATFTGEFDLHTVHVWLDHRFAPKGYAYMIPISHHEASAAIAYPNYPEIEQTDSSVYWHAFLEKMSQEFSTPPKIKDEFEVTKYLMGLAPRPRIGNTFFTGNCFGTLTPFLGFGQFAAILTGIYAAHDLLGKGNYEQLIKPLKDSYQNSLVLRKAVETLDNNDFDRMVAALASPLADRLYNSKLDSLRLISRILRPWIFLKAKLSTETAGKYL